MYKILIAEDEDMIRKGIVKAIDWESLKISSVIEATNGEEALTLFEELQPEIILSDIRMPRLNGLELLSLIREINENAVFIILSGYEEFEYARCAIKEGAFSYLLKTSGKDELVQTLQDGIKQLDRLHNKEKIEEQTQQKFNKNLPVLRTQLLNELIHHPYVDETLISRMKLAEIEFDFQKYQLSLAELDTDMEGIMVLSAKDQLLYTFCINNIIEEVFSDSIVFQSYDGKFIVINRVGEDKQMHKRIVEKWELVQNLINLYYQVTISVAMTDSYCGMNQVKDAYLDAKRIISYKFSSGNNSIITENDVRNEYSGIQIISEDDLVHLKREIIIGNETNVFGILNEIYSKDNIRTMDINSYRLLCFKLVEASKKAMLEIDKTLIEEILGDVELLSETNSIQTFNAGKNWVMSYYSDALELIRSRRISKSKSIILQAKQYIDDNYKHEITLNDVAAYIHLSPSYFSGLFTQEIGMSFLAYLTGLRINKAKELLVQEKYNVSEVGIEVGYPNPYYFSRIFKKHTGYSPMDYKAKV